MNMTTEKELHVDHRLLTLIPIASVCINRYQTELKSTILLPGFAADFIGRS